MARTSTEKQLACVVCHQRKVKCDAVKPRCGNCVRADIVCSPSTWRPPRKRKRTEQSETVLEAEPPDVGRQALRQQDGQASKKPDVAAVHPISQTDKLQIVNTLWGNLAKETREEAAEEHDVESGVLPQAGIIARPGALLLSPGSQEITEPSPLEIIRLWQIFLENVDPLVKLFHVPSVQSKIFDAAANLKSIPDKTSALIHGILLIAVVSVSESDCMGILNCEKQVALSRYTRTAEHVLHRAGYLRSDSLETLQGFVLYLLAMRKYTDAASLWMMTGVAVRISQRMNVHQGRQAKSLSPFELEMRRRVEWQVFNLDVYAAKHAGQPPLHDLGSLDMDMPLNVSDSDLSPDMTILPADRDGPTEMLFVRLRCELIRGLKLSHVLNRSDDSEQVTLENIIKSTKAKDELLDRVEREIRDKYLRKCDASILLHQVCMLMLAGFVSSLRFAIHHPRQYPPGTRIPEAEKNKYFSHALASLSSLPVLFERPALSVFRWHMDVHFPLDALIYVLSELRSRTSGKEVEDAWRTCDAIYKLKPELMDRHSGALNFAIGTLALKAWRERRKALSPFRLANVSGQVGSDGQMGIDESAFGTASPAFIQILYEQRQRMKARRLGYGTAAAQVECNFDSSRIDSTNPNGVGEPQSRPIEEDNRLPGPHHTNSANLSNGTINGSWSAVNDMNRDRHYPSFAAPNLTNTNGNNITTTSKYDDGLANAARLPDSSTYDLGVLPPMDDAEWQHWQSLLGDDMLSLEELQEDWGSIGLATA